MSLDLNSTNVEYKDKKVIIKDIPKNGENLSVFIRPGDEVVFDIEGLNSDELEYILVGGDIVVSFANEGVLTFPSLGLMGFSDNPPQFNFGGNKFFSVDNILSKIEEVNELPITSVDASFKVTTSNNEEDEPPTETKIVVVSQSTSEGSGSKPQDFVQEQVSSSSITTSQSNTTPGPGGGYEYVPPNDYDAYEPDEDLVPKPDVDLSADSGSSHDINKGDGNVSDAAKPAFYFKATAHQVTYSETTSDEGEPLILGGGGSLEGYEFDSVTNQFETETIDMSARSEDMVIRAENSTYFDNNPANPNYLSRVLKFEPQMPEGFYVNSFSITGLLANVKILDKNGVEIGNVISKEQMIFKDELGNIIEVGSPNFITEFKSAEFTIKYEDSISNPFNISITANYQLDPAYADATDIEHSQTHTNNYTIALKDITEADDYIYAKEDFANGADEGFILSKDANTNTIIDGSGDSSIVGGMGIDYVYDGVGDDSIYLSGGSDTTYAGVGHNTIDGDAYLKEDGITQVDYDDGRDKVSYENVKSYSLAELKYLKDNGYINTQEYEKLSASYQLYEPNSDPDAVPVPIANSLDIEMLKYYKGVYVDLEGFTDEDTLWVDSNENGIVDDDEKINALSKFSLKEDFVFTYDENGNVTGATGTELPEAGLQNIQLSGQDKFENIEDVDGSAYNDSIYGNDEKNIISGLEGSDTLDGRGGGDELYGGAGNDTLYSGSGDDTIDGGDDADAVNYQNALNGVVVRLDKPDGADHDDYSTGYGDDTLLNIEDVTGSNHNDTIYGNSGTNYIMGMDGDDDIIAGRGYDFIDGGDGSDWISYYSPDYPNRATNSTYMEDIQGITVTMGSDFVMVKETSTDRLIDLIKDVEEVSGTTGNDYIWGLASNSATTAVDEKFWGHEGNDNLRGWAGNDELYGGADDDYLLSGRGVDFSDGGEGVDFLHLYYDSIRNKAVQQIRLSDEVDKVGTVQYSIDSGANWIDGYLTPESHNDNTAYDNSIFNIDNLSKAINIEGLHGSYYDDYFIGNSQDNLFNAHNGNDEIYAMQGNDTFLGHSYYNISLENMDIMDGGTNTNGDPENDTLNYNSSSHAFVLDMTNLDIAGTVTNGVNTEGYATVDFSASTGKVIFNDKIINIENIHGSTGADTITGDANANIINGWWGLDTIDGGAGNDILYGGVHVDTVRGGDGNDYINLDQYSDTDLRVHGQSGEYAYGGAGNDTIVSQGGSDYLYGDAGDDEFVVNYRPIEIYGGIGTDTLTLGDTYLDVRTTDIQGIEILNVESGRTYFNYSQFFTDNAFIEVTGDTNSQLYVIGSNDVDDSFDFSDIDLSGFQGTLYAHGYYGTGTDTLKMGGGVAGDQTVNMLDNYYNTLEKFDIASGSTLEVNAYNDSERSFYAHNKDFDDVAGDIDFIGGAGNDTFYANYEALLAGKINIEGGVGSDEVDVRTSQTNATLDFNLSDMFNNIETLDLHNISSTNNIILDAVAMKEWLSPTNHLELDLSGATQAAKVTVDNTQGADMTGFEIGQTYDITLDDNTSFTMAVV
nr:calcium-binding protein [uncultured Sulfurimonas sp.]